MNLFTPGMVSLIRTLAQTASLALLCLGLAHAPAWSQTNGELDDLAEDAAEEAAEEEAENAAQEAAESSAEAAAEEEAENAAQEAAESSAEAAAEEEAENAAQEAAENTAEETAEEEAEDAAEDEAEEMADAVEEAGNDAEESAEEAAEATEDTAEDAAESANAAASAPTDDYSERVLEELDDLEFDANQGDFIVSNELLIIADAEQIDTVEQMPEIILVSRESLTSLDLSMARFVVREGYRLNTVRETLRRRFPDLSVDFNHGYKPAQKLPQQTENQTPVAGFYRQPPRHPDDVLRLGMIDSAVDADHPALKQADITQRSFLERGQPPSRQHGTAVASLLLADSPKLSGLIPGARLFIASVFSEHPEQGLITTTHSLVRGLDWLASEQLPVINISLAGPANQTLERIIQALIERGIWLVAAAGNEGPLSPPRYPAAYPGVIAVTATDTQGKAYRHAGRGPHLDYAAPGVDLRAASTRANTGFERVSGTSYATALVSGLIAYYRSESASNAALKARLERELIDLGKPGLDPVFGRGLLGKSLLLEPNPLH